MPGKFFSFPFKVVYWLICLTLIAALTGCGPKIPASMSDEDLQTCDEHAYKDQVPEYGESFYDEYPFLAPASDVDLWSPLNGSILPHGEPVVIKFDQPPATDGVLFRNYQVIVTSIDGSNTEYVGNQWAVVSMSSFNVQVNWMPPGSGKYIINVFIRNIETLDWLLGNPANYSEELAKQADSSIHSGPFSVAHVCVQIDVPKAADVVQGSPQAVNIQPLQDYTKPAPTITKTLTWTPTVTATFTPTFTSTFTFTPFIPTFTATKPPTRIPPTDIPPTDVPPTEVPPVICASFLDPRSCEVNNACKWTIPATGAPPYCEDK